LRGLLIFPAIKFAPIRWDVDSGAQVRTENVEIAVKLGLNRCIENTASKKVVIELLEAFVFHGVARQNHQAVVSPGPVCWVGVLKNIVVVGELIAEGLAHKFPYNHYVLQNTHPANWAWGHNGLMILSRYPMKNERLKQLDYYFLRRSVLYATVETELHGDLDVLCTHLSTAINIPPYWGEFDSWEDEQPPQTQGE
jgi:hypothetical protein